MREKLQGIIFRNGSMAGKRTYFPKYKVLSTNAVKRPACKKYTEVFEPAGG